mmetsp:Transcript_31492/g.78913  ORF Transcript_31492/g.78913 Transcript_31492/m.78913 type:complete len:101 (+) Transcript_31492:173-475(+)
MPPNVQYSDRYYDDIYEYRHVVLPQELARMLPKGKLLSEMEWRLLGVQQSPGWVHYTIHKPEPHVMLFRRPLNYQQQMAQQQQQQQQMMMAQNGHAVQHH